MSYFGRSHRERASTTSERLIFLERPTWQVELRNGRWRDFCVGQVGSEEAPGALIGVLRNSHIIIVQAGEGTLNPTLGKATNGAVESGSEGAEKVLLHRQLMGRRWIMTQLADAVLLRIFVGEEDTYEGRPLYEAIVETARQRKLAGATALRGPGGFGRSRYVRTEFNVDAGSNVPMVVEIVDDAEKIDAFLLLIEHMVESGLVTLEGVRALRYSAGKRIIGFVNQKTEGR